MIIFRVCPLKTNGKLLVPTGVEKPFASDYLKTDRAVVDICKKLGWEVHERSGAMRTRVVGELPPVAVVKAGNGLLVGLWLIPSGTPEWISGFFSTTYPWIKSWKATTGICMWTRSDFSGGHYL